MLPQTNFISKPTKLCFVLFLCTTFLPWFGTNLNIQSPCRGLHFLGWFFIPLFIIGLYLFSSIRNSIFTITTELCCIANIILIFFTTGYYYKLGNISGGWNWIEGWHAIQPGFWISVICFLIFFIVFQYDIWLKNR